MFAGSIDSIPMKIHLPPASAIRSTSSSRRSARVTPGTGRLRPCALRRGGPPGEARGIVRLAGGDALAADDVFHFVVARAQTRAVLVVEPAGAGPNTRLYLTRALALARDPGYEVTDGQTVTLDTAGATIERVTPDAYELVNLGGTGTISLAELVSIDTAVAVNADLKQQMSNLPRLVAHESYPGHHTEHCRKEAGLVGQ